MFCTVSLTTTFAFAQNGNSNPNANTQENWKLNGNTSDTTKFIGTTNQTDLVFKSNNTEGFRLNAASEAKFTGDVYLNQLKIIQSTPKSRFLQVTNEGKITSIEKSALINTLYQPLSACLTDQNGNIFSVWKQNPHSSYGILFTGIDCSTRVGIGTDLPLASFDVRGRGLFSERLGIGTILPEDKLQVGDNISKMVVGDAYSRDLRFGTSILDLIHQEKIQGFGKLQEMERITEV